MPSGNSLVLDLALARMDVELSFLDHMIEDERCLIQRLPISSKACLFIAGVFSLMVGSCMKGFIYRHLYNFKLKDRPINILILLEQVIHHVFSFQLIVSNLTWMITNTAGAEALEPLMG